MNIKTKNVNWGDIEEEKEEKESCNIISYQSFDDMGLKETVLRGIYSYGFKHPSVIQQRAIVPISTGRDIIGQAQSGTGKTATFTVGILQAVDESLMEPQCIIIAPTRELADQINQVVTSLSVHAGIGSLVCIGGIKVRDNMNSLRRYPPHVVIGTPGRILDLINRRALKLQSIKMLCLDEADEMLSKGFQEDVRDIISRVSENTQILLFSATMPEECLELTTRFMKSPIKILVKKEQLTLLGISQFYVDCGQDRQKFGVLREIYSEFSIQQAVIFCNSKRRVEWLADRMNEESFGVSKIHGGIPSAERMEIMKDFRLGGTRVLISTDLLARGIDVQQVSVVINYDLPFDKENYLHRIGRSGRFGRKGVAVNFITQRDYRYLQLLKRFYDTDIAPLPKNFQDLL